MRDLNLGPDSRALIASYNVANGEEIKAFRLAEIAKVAADMSKMLERWLDIGWCWPDACPAQICGGPHFRVKYQHDRMLTTHNPVEVIEQAQHVGETYPDVPYTIIRS
jgi:hypothetical protein